MFERVPFCEALFCMPGVSYAKSILCKGILRIAKYVFFFTSVEIMMHIQGDGKEAGEIRITPV